MAGRASMRGLLYFHKPVTIQALALTSSIARDLKHRFKNNKGPKNRIFFERSNYKSDSPRGFGLTSLGVVSVREAIFHLRLSAFLQKFFNPVLLFF